MCLKTLVYSLLSLLALPAFSAHASLDPQVKLGKTTIVGRGLSDKVDFFGGIPFAETPVGPLRLSPPVLKTRLDVSTFDASAFRKACVQPYIDPALVSEDCLTVNVFRPAGVSSGEKLPVLFWTYGGAFVIGASNEWLYNATNLVARSLDRGTPVIYVSFNYRLGPLGFPQGQEADDRRALNLGVLDQTAALQWVHENIHFFGGDKDKVTIFGESAGAILTATQLLNPQLSKLARGAILESGSPNSLRSWSAARNEAGWQDFVSNVASCSNLSTSGRTFDCLKLAPASEIVEAINEVIDLAGDLPWGVTLDKGKGSVFPGYPSQLYAQAHFSTIPVMSGTNLDEVGDMLFTAPRRQWTRTVAGAGVKAYVYHYTMHRDASSEAQPHLGVPHGAEVAYVFGLVSPSDRVAQEMSRVMTDYWISFADSLDPNDGKGVKRPVWPQYTEHNQLADPGGNWTVGKDDFREEQTGYLNANALDLRR